MFYFIKKARTFLLQLVSKKKYPVEQLHMFDWQVSIKLESHWVEAQLSLNFAVMA